MMKLWKKGLFLFLRGVIDSLKPLLACLLVIKAFETYVDARSSSVRKVNAWSSSLRKKGES